MASAGAEIPVESPPPKAIDLPQVTCEETEEDCEEDVEEEVEEEVDGEKKMVQKMVKKTTKKSIEEKFDCPQAWFLALLTVAMSAMTSITVAGSLFFLLAAPEKVSPHCYERENLVVRGFCTASTLCFWTYPVVCCLFVVLVFAKNLVDQRTYYEFLLHKVVVVYPKSNPIQQPVVLALLVYALGAFSALVWFHLSQATVMVSHVYSCLAYITPIISFLAVIFSSWSIQGKLITLPNFLENHVWAMSHLNHCRFYPVETVHHGYNCLEAELERCDVEAVDTPRLVALVEHYTKTVQEHPLPAEDVETPAETKATTSLTAAKDAAEEVANSAAHALVRGAQEAKEWVYWEVRLLFNPRLQDARSQSFRNWALAYMVSVILAIIFSVYIFICCLITCLEIERVLTNDMHAWTFTHGFSLRPDLGNANEHKSLKQVAASVAMSAMQTGARAFSNRGHPTGLLHFSLGAAL